MRSCIASRLRQVNTWPIHPFRLHGGSRPINKSYTTAAPSPPPPPLQPPSPLKPSSPPSSAEAPASKLPELESPHISDSQTKVLKNLIRKSLGDPPAHPFDSFQVVQQLRNDGGFTTTQAIALMECLRACLTEGITSVHGDMLRKADLDNSAHLFKAALTELRTEIRVLREIDKAALKAELDGAEQDIDSIRHRLNEDMVNLKSEVQIDLNQYKSDQRASVQTMEEALQETNDRFVLSLGIVRTEMEAVKWETTRKGIMSIYGGVAVVALIWMLLPARPNEADRNGDASNSSPTERLDEFLTLSNSHRAVNR
ncbi:hypothetical protein H4R34_000831 [Dimargaris verticillata]|uniref:Mitochondrial protein n=1 Tax=Dimargaris verticillata TaxID=2761393 RepID=A0A9W8B7D5_9FUNG|nr:hypothetical protein H4R34_000831 [Dimargaris verticillata]